MGMLQMAFTISKRYKSYQGRVICPIISNRRWKKEIYLGARSAVSPLPQCFKFLHNTTEQC